MFCDYPHLTYKKSEYVNFPPFLGAGTDIRFRPPDTIHESYHFIIALPGSVKSHFIVCEEEKQLAPRIFGAPEFVAEVLSPSSRNRDLVVKLGKYFNAGVKEYWILSPEKQTVTVYLFGGETQIRHYTFDDDIPVEISDGLCVVSLKGMKKWL